MFKQKVARHLAVFLFASKALMQLVQAVLQHLACAWLTCRPLLNLGSALHTTKHIHGTNSSAMHISAQAYGWLIHIWPPAGL